MFRIPSPARLLGAVLFLASTGAVAEGVNVELNKLEAGEDACRAFVVLHNDSPHQFESLKLDLVVFDPDGIVSRRLAVETAPIPTDKTLLKVFGIDGLACDGISRVLLNDVLECRDANGERSDCLPMVSTSAKPGLEFIK